MKTGEAAKGIRSGERLSTVGRKIDHFYVLFPQVTPHLFLQRVRSKDCFVSRKARPCA